MNITGMKFLTSNIIDAARESACRSVNAAYWLIGRRIVEFEQSGAERAEYGSALLERLAADLAGPFGCGFSLQNVQNMRLFYLSYSPEPICQTVSGNLARLPAQQTRQTLSGESEPDLAELVFDDLLAAFPLPWSAEVLGAEPYARSKSGLEIPRSLRIWWRVPVARSRFPCLGMMARRPLAGFIHTL